MPKLRVNLKTLLFTGDMQFVGAVSPQYAIMSTDTAKDRDSTRPQVMYALKDARVYVTQDHPNVIIITIPADGSIGVTSL